ncbi:LamB/YcsF family protein [Nocardia rhamnosiphila]
MAAPVREESTGSGETELTRPPVPTIDLNADLGEGFGAWTMGDDSGLLQVVTSANVACGFHAGDPDIMRRVCAHAAAAEVIIGAHVGYRDPIGFGRRDLAIGARELRNETVYQIAALDGLARAENTLVRYVKPHGALYHRLARSDETAAALVAAIVDYNSELTVLGIPDSALSRRCADAGITFRTEGFADRGYLDNGLLSDRSIPGSVITEPDDASAQALAIATRRQIRSLTGALVAVEVDSICVHGDSPHALETARRVHRALVTHGVTPKAFA